MFKESETSIDLNTLLSFSLANIRCFLQRFSKFLRGWWLRLFYRKKKNSIFVE